MQHRLRNGIQDGAHLGIDLSPILEPLGSLLGRPGAFPRPLGHLLGASWNLLKFDLENRPQKSVPEGIQAGPHSLLRRSPAEAETPAKAPSELAFVISRK